MGRSGTSAITRMFTKAGFFAGSDDDLLPATEANPTGHWENTGVWRANERILEQLGGSWLDPPPEAIQRAARASAVPALVGEVKRICQQAGSRPIVIKDPRIGVLMPLWRPVLVDCLHPVLAIRDPFEIALSLHRRDKTSLPFGLAAWELHMTSLLNHLEGFKVTVAPYERLLNDGDLASLIVEVAVCQVDRGLAETVRPVEARAAFKRTLHRNRAALTDHDENLTTHQHDLWKYLSSLGVGDQDVCVPERLQFPSNSALTTVRHETERLAAEALRNRLAATLRSERDQLSKILSAERARSISLANSLTNEQQRAAVLVDELSSERQRVKVAQEERAQTVRWLTAMRSSTSWRVTAPLRTVKRMLRDASSDSINSQPAK